MHVISALHKAKAEDHGPVAVPLYCQLGEIYNHPGDASLGMPTRGFTEI